MSPDGLTDEQLRAILAGTRRIAVVGASARADRPSHAVLGFLLARGYDVTPVNPGIAGSVLQGREVVSSLEDAAPLDMVDIFRAADAVPPIVDAAVRLGARTIWMQLGVISPDAAAVARRAGQS